MKMNTLLKRGRPRTYEGGPAVRMTPERELRRAVLACLLWEDSFYESGQSVAKRIEALVPRVEPEVVAELAVEARHGMKLRHAPLWVIVAMTRSPAHLRLVGRTLQRVISRADEPAEFLAMYWADGRRPLAKQVKTGLASALTKFDAYELAKYDRAGAVRLRDVLFLTHAKPRDAAQTEAFGRLASGTLVPAKTWEVALSAGGSVKSDREKRDRWTELLTERRMGALAVLRNLRNMEEAGVKPKLIRRAIDEMRPGRVLPMRFIAAARHAPRYEPALERAMFRSVSAEPMLRGHTAVLVDVSYSMVGVRVSKHSDLTRLDAAAALAMLAAQASGSCAVFTFSNDVKRMPPRRGFALRDVIVGQEHGGTYLGKAVATVNELEQYDRLIVITDEQSHDPVGPPAGRGYLLNVATYRHAVGYGPWVRIDGWSEAVLRYIRESEHASYT
ncbi:MAG: TROVE domain-containing protein [Planctomycetota bacterium]